MRAAAIFSAGGRCGAVTRPRASPCRGQAPALGRLGVLESLQLWVVWSLARLLAVMALSARHSGQAERRPARDGGRDGLYRRQRIPSVDVLPALFGMRPRIQLAFMEGSVCCKRLKDLHSKRSEQ